MVKERYTCYGYVVGVRLLLPLLGFLAFSPTKAGIIPSQERVQGIIPCLAALAGRLSTPLNLVAKMRISYVCTACLVRTCSDFSLMYS